MGKYSRLEIADLDRAKFDIQVIIANELAEANRLKRFELTEGFTRAHEELEDRA